MYVTAAGAYLAADKAENGTCGEEDLGGVVLEMAGACWVMPQFYGKVGKVKLLATFKDQLVGQLSAEPAYASCDGIKLLRALWGHGGPLSNLTLKTCTRAGLPGATAPKKGVLAKTLHKVVEALVVAFMPPVELEAFAEEAGYCAPAALVEALGDYGEQSFGGNSLKGVGKKQLKNFEQSFVFECGEDVWGDAACEPLAELVGLLGEILDAPSDPAWHQQDDADDAYSWLSRWTPLNTHQHGDLNAANVLVDVRDGLWLIDFAKSGVMSAFQDASKMMAVILFEYYPIPMSFSEARHLAADPERLGQRLQIKDHEVEALVELLRQKETWADFAAAAAEVPDAARALKQMDDDEAANARCEEACAVIDQLLLLDEKSAEEEADAPELWQMAAVRPPDGWPLAAKLALGLASQIVSLSCDLVAKCGEESTAAAEEGAPSHADLHASALLLPLVKEALSALRYIDLCVGRKRVAWHLAQACAATLVRVLGRPPRAPPSARERSAGATSLQLRGDSVLLMLTDKADRIGGGEGGGHLFAVVDADELPQSERHTLCVEKVVPEHADEADAIAKGLVEPQPCSFDEFSQVMLPWRQQTDDSMGRVLEGARSDVHCVTQLSTLSEMLEPGTTPNREDLRELASALRNLKPPCSGVLVELVGTVTELVDTLRLAIVQISTLEKEVRSEHKQLCEIADKVGAVAVAVEARRAVTSTPDKARPARRARLVSGEGALGWREQRSSKETGEDATPLNSHRTPIPTPERFRPNPLGVKSLGVVGVERIGSHARAHGAEQLTERSSLSGSLAEEGRRFSLASCGAACSLEACLAPEYAQALDEVLDTLRDERMLCLKKHQSAQERRAEAAERVGWAQAALARLERGAPLLQPIANAEVPDEAPEVLVAALERDAVSDDDGDGAVVPRKRRASGEGTLTPRPGMADGDEEAEGGAGDVGGAGGDQDGLAQSRPPSSPAPAEVQADECQALRADALAALAAAQAELAPQEEAAEAARKALEQIESELQLGCRQLDRHLELGALAKRVQGLSAEARHSGQVLREKLQAGCGPAEWRAIDRFFRAKLQALGAMGVRRYAPGQALYVRAGRSWRDAVVVESPDKPWSCEHTLRLDGFRDEGVALALSPFNHTPCMLPSASFRALKARHCRTMRAQHASIIDALSGRRLDTLATLVPIELTVSQRKRRGSIVAAKPKKKQEEGTTVKDVADLAQWLRKAHSSRLEGAVSEAMCVLLTAGPAAGKTCLMSQLVMHVVPPEPSEGGGEGDGADDDDDDDAHALVPILIRVQDLQKRLLGDEDSFASSWNWVDAYLRELHGLNSEMYRFLRQALMARRALLMLDGIDEGGKARERIERHITEVLAPQGHVMLLTSRPNGVKAELFVAEGFHTLNLKPLNDAQQQAVVRRRLGVDADEDDAQQQALVGKAADSLMEYIRTRVPTDTETGARVTGNPLMLSMVMSIFESHQIAAMDRQAEEAKTREAERGREASAEERAAAQVATAERVIQGMPKTITELYSVAASAMLDRLEKKSRGDAGAPQATSADHLRQLLESLFFQSHAQVKRLVPCVTFRDLP